MGCFKERAGVLNRAILGLGLVMGALTLGGCVNSVPKPDNPYYAPVEPIETRPARINNGSIYNVNDTTSLNLYSDQKARHIGDIITISLEEQTQSSKTSNTSVDKANDTNVGANATAFGRNLTVDGRPLSASLSSNSSFSGSGSSDMGNSLTGNITVTVHKIYPNGNLLVRGEKWLTLNQGDEYIRVSGIIRPQDIDDDNSVPSTRLADARISYSGTGSVHNATVMGWLAKFFISPLFPF